MFPLGFLIHSSNNFGNIKTEAIIGFGPSNYQNSTFKPLEIVYGGKHFERSLKDSKSFNEKRSKVNIKNSKVALGKKHKKHSKHKLKKCFYKYLKKKGKKHKLWKKKFLLPLLAGFLAAKGLLLPLALKALAFVSLKGLLIGFFSATILSLRGILSHSYGHYT